MKKYLIPKEIRDLDNMVSHASDLLIAGRKEEANTVCVYVLDNLRNLERKRSNGGTAIGGTIGFLVGVLTIPPLWWIPTLVGTKLGKLISNVDTKDIRNKCYTIKNNISID